MSAHCSFFAPAGVSQRSCQSPNVFLTTPCARAVSAQPNVKPRTQAAIPARTTARVQAPFPTFSIVQPADALSSAKFSPCARFRDHGPPALSSGEGGCETDAGAAREETVGFAQVKSEDG